MKLNASLIEIVQIHTASYEDADKSGSIHLSYPFDGLSSSCAFQAVIPPSDVDAREDRHLNDLQHPKLYSKNDIYFAIFGFVEQMKNRNRNYFCLGLE